MLARFRRVSSLGREPNLRRFGLACLAYSLTEFAAWITILVYAFERGGVVESGVVATAMLLPAIAITPLATWAAFRFSRRWALVAGHLGISGCLVAGAGALALGLPAPLLYLALIGVSLGISFCRPLQTDVIVMISRTPDQLAAGNVYLGLIESVGQLAGPLIVALLLPPAGVQWIFSLLGMTMAVSVAGVVRLDLDEAREGDSGEGAVAGIYRELVEGLRLVTRHGDSGVLIGLLATREVVVGAIDVLAVAIAFELLGSGEAGAALLNAAFGVGLTLGALLALQRADGHRIGRTIGQGALATGLSLALISAVSSDLLALGLLVLAGIGALQIEVAGRMLLQRVAEPQRIAQTFAALESWSLLAIAVGTMGVSGLVAWLEVAGALVVVGLTLGVSVLVRAPRIRRLESRYEPPSARVLAALRGVDIFEPLGVLVLEQLARAAMRVEGAAGDVLIREGEPAGPVYILLEGNVGVTTAGRFVRRQGPGEYFGEIAPLHSSARTATVVAETAVEALAIEPEVFLDAIRSHRRSFALAQGSASARAAH
jgi:MFS family permease